MDASQIYSQQRRSGNCFAAGGEEHEFARCDAPPPSCVFNPEQEEGPYYVDRELLRSDITEGKVGVPLRVRVTVVNAKTCAPIPNAALDIWHCDAGGVYSGYTKINPGFGPGPGGRPPGPPPNAVARVGLAGPRELVPGGPGGPGARWEGSWWNAAEAAYHR